MPRFSFGLSRSSSTKAQAKGSPNGLPQYRPLESSDLLHTKTGRSSRRGLQRLLMIDLRKSQRKSESKPHAQATLASDPMSTNPNVVEPRVSQEEFQEALEIVKARQLQREQEDAKWNAESLREEIRVRKAYLAGAMEPEIKIRGTSRELMWEAYINQLEGQLVVAQAKVRELCGTVGERVLAQKRQRSQDGATKRNCDHCKHLNRSAQPHQWTSKEGERIQQGIYEWEMARRQEEAEIEERYQILAAQWEEHVEKLQEKQLERLYEAQMDALYKEELLISSIKQGIYDYEESIRIIARENA